MSANWHKDPLGRAEYRWYDGTAWTLRVANGGVESMEPEGTSLSASSASPAAQQSPSYGQTPAAAPAPSYGGEPGYGQAPTYGQTPAYGQQAAYGQQPAYGQAAPNGGKGRLLAAGVLSIISGVVWVLLAILVLSVSTSDLGGFVNDVSGGLLTVFFLIFLALGAGFIAAGWGACIGKAWGQISIIALGGISILLALIGMFQDGDGSGVIPILWFGTMVGLAISAKPSTFNR